MKTFLPNTTPTPNWLFNGEMKKMNETELKIVMLITRKTLGWFDIMTGDRKEQDFISQSQFIGFTGQSHTAIAKAIQRSVEVGWIIARDKNGNLCDSPEKRKRRKIWYCLGSVFVEKASKQQSGLDDKEVENLSNKVAESKQHFASNLSNKVDNTKETITKETITKEKAQAPRLPEWIPKNTFHEYLEMRRKIRKPLLEKSFNRFFSALKKLCDTTRSTPEQILDQSILNSWQGIFPLKTGGNGNGKGIRTSRSDPRDPALQSREDAEIAAITAKYYAAKQSARSNAGGDADKNDAPDFSGV